jgi:hypothetical protein
MPSAPNMLVIGCQSAHADLQGVVYPGSIHAIDNSIGVTLCSAIVTSILLKGCPSAHGNLQGVVYPDSIHAIDYSIDALLLCKMLVTCYKQAVICTCHPAGCCVPGLHPRDRLQQ